MSVIELRPSGPGRIAHAAAPTEARARPLAWPAAITGLVFLIWLVPLTLYSLPVALPFKLEPYRLAILALSGLLALAVIAGRTRLNFVGHGKPILLLAVVALGSQVANAGTINALGLQTQSLKSLSLFLSFLIVFVLVTSTLRSFDQINFVVTGVVLGGAIVAVAALYEAKFHHNVFDHLNRWIPFLRENGAAKLGKLREGRLRVRASAQHPIALAGAMLVTFPLAVYLSRRAVTRARSWFWLAVGGLLVTAAIATLSRTAVSMLIAISIVGLVFRAKPILRRWPLLLVLVLLTHLAAPGAIKQLYKAFNPKGGLVHQQGGRAGQSGSGRVADLSPGLKRWESSPVLGHGLGTNPTLADPVAVVASGSSARQARGIIYDDQYLTTLVTLGALGLAGVVWFVWGAVRKLGRAVRRTGGMPSDFLVACTASCAAFGVSMFTYDALSFVQATLLFFVIAALGLRAKSLLRV